MRGGPPLHVHIGTEARCPFTVPLAWLNPLNQLNTVNVLLPLYYFAGNWGRIGKKTIAGKHSWDLSYLYANKARHDCCGYGHSLTYSFRRCMYIVKYQTLSIHDQICSIPASSDRIYVYLRGMEPTAARSVTYHRTPKKISYSLSKRRTHIP